MISLPLWAAFLIGFGSPILAFVGVLVAQLFQRRAATELETRSKREETMRNLRWAAELAVGTDERLSELGVAELEALLDSDLLEEEQKTFVEAALDTVYAEPRETLEKLGDDGEAVEVGCSGRTATAGADPELGSKPQMAKQRVPVTSAQKSAAKAMVKRSAVTGRSVSTSVQKIAHAKPARAAHEAG